MKQIEIIENFIKTRTVGKVQNVCLSHLEDIKGIKTINKDSLRQLYKDYLYSFVATQELRDFYLNEYDETT